MDRCPMQYLDPVAVGLLRFFRFFQMGWLPNDGGILDQPCAFIEAMEYLMGQVAKTEREHADESRTGGHPHTQG